MDELEEKPIGQPAKQAWRLVKIAFLIGAVPALPQVFGFQFTPSAEWTRTAFVPGLAGGLLGGILLPCLLSRHIDNMPGNDLKKLCAALASPLGGFFLGKSSIVIAGPMILAVIAGHQTDLTYVVDDAHPPSSRGCRSPLSLQELPFFFDKLCGVKNEFKLGLARGSKIVVTGRGTSFGIFAYGMRRFD
ncbi:hypothetical protein J2T08_004284 [Neorhizobium galegae]|uniref:hypothetical protein n=1 Tax=Neorhizobium galegae TaxID=399 RepID=UPI001AE6E9BE|nr:hypothetical protein [Neorhizobium galegae]MBP2557692.1 hypothetical protein [Neorhizobium galegae]MDQ0136348.1 hypothetical protein [Neorhizobium galegae]